MTCWAEGSKRNCTLSMKVWIVTWCQASPGVSSTFDHQHRYPTTKMYFGLGLGRMYIVLVQIITFTSIKPISVT